MEGVIATEIVASHYKPPPVFCTKAKVAKGGGYLQDTMVCVLFILVRLSNMSCTEYHQLPYSEKFREHKFSQINTKKIILQF